MPGLYAIASGPIAGLEVDVPADDTEPHLAVEVSFTTGALEEPVWVDITGDARSYNVLRGRDRELERCQPGRATVVLDNRDRRYDRSHSGGPWFGNLRPMRRMRIRETFNGVTYPVFDGFIDRWQLDYPGTGHDATATIVATDAFKIFQRTDLPSSVWVKEINDDPPPIWWRLDETLEQVLAGGTAANAGTGGSTYDATFTGSPFLGSAPLVVHDPGTAMDVQDAGSAPGTPLMGATLGNATLDLLNEEPEWSIECWIRLERPFSDSGVFAQMIATVSRSAELTTHMDLFWTADLDTGLNGRLVFRIDESGGGDVYAVRTPDGSVLPGEVHHVVAVVEADGQMAIWLDGTRYTPAVSGATGTDISGVSLGTGDLNVGFDGNGVLNSLLNWNGTIDEVLVWFEDLGATRVAAHYAAGTHPWQGDTAPERLDRILDIVGWPSELRAFDTGMSTLQSATLGTTALEHLYKVAETELGLLFMTRSGVVRFVNFTNQGINTPYFPLYIGDDTGEVGYTAITFDDGDGVIRDRAVISRLNGVAKIAEDSGAIDEFGRFDFTLEGLLHDSDSYSQDYADFIVAEYASPRRRVSSVTISTPPSGEEAITYPMMLGREIGEHVTVRNRPPGGGDPFEQTCVVEGIELIGTPGFRQVTFTLSPIIVNEF